MTISILMLTFHAIVALAFSWVMLNAIFRKRWWGMVLISAWAVCVLSTLNWVEVVFGFGMFQQVICGAS